MEWFLWKDTAHCGAVNMAVDAYNLENPPASPLLRFFSWHPPAVSIGCNQKLSGWNSVLFDEMGIDLVKRPTGGRAVYHNNEITYSVIIPESSDLFELSVHQLYHAVSKAIAAGLSLLGIQADIERNTPKPQKNIGRPLHECFESIARFEIKQKGRKMVGSAQRRLPAAVLQQGSILITDEQYMLEYFLNPNTNHIMPSEKPINQVAMIDPLIPKDTIIESILQGFEQELGCLWHIFSETGSLIKKVNLFQHKFTLYRANDNTEQKNQNCNQISVSI